MGGERWVGELTYKPGDLKQVGPCPHGRDEDGQCVEYECNDVRDSRRDDDSYAPLAEGGVYLPHSCDSWVIGGPEEIRALIADLQAALERA